MKNAALRIGYYCKFKHPKDSQSIPRIGLVVSFDKDMVVIWHERNMLGLHRCQVIECNSGITMNTIGRIQ